MNSDSNSNTSLFFSVSEVTALWCYTNLFIIVIIISDTCLDRCRLFTSTQSTALTMKRSHGKTAWRFSSFSSKSVLSYVEFYLETFLVCEFCLICMLLGSFGESLGDVATYVAHSHTHTHLTALFPGLPRWAGTRKVKPIWILLNHETVSGIGISWAMCKSAPRSRQITTPAPHHSHTHTHTCLTALCPGLPW